MKKLIITAVFLLFVSYGIPFYIENKEKYEPIKRIEEISKKVLLKGDKLKIDITDSKNYYIRAKKQVSLQENKPFFLRDYGYAEELFQKSINSGLKEIKKFKEKERAEKENFLNKIESARDLNSKISEIFEKIPLGSEFFVEFLKSTVYLKEAENLYNFKRLKEAKEKVEIAYFLSENLYSKIKNSLISFYSPEKLKEWRNLYNEAISISSRENVIVVIKDERILKVLRNGRVLSTYSVDFGKNPLSKKTKSGDLATPEGRYKVLEKRGYGRTKYYLALLLNYPNEEDKRRFEEAKRKGIIPKNSKIGGLIEIHGDGGLGIDWTEGCVALSNEDMKELYNIASVGTAVYIIGSLGNNGVLSEMENAKTWKSSKNS